MEAVIFDIDGTLIDSVDLHGAAWQEALKHFGKIVDFQCVRDQVGKGGDELLKEFLTEQEIERRGEQIKTYRSEIFREKYLCHVKPLAKVRELFLRMREAGKRIAIGSSAKQRELEHYLKLLDIEDLVDVTVSSEDASRAKPHPDIFQIALEKLGVKASNALVVGDSPYDAEAAAKIGIVSIGFLSGGFKPETLKRAGMTDLFENPSDYLSKLQVAPKAT